MSMYECLGSSDIPCRVLIFFQRTSVFTGDFKKTFLAFERTWSGNTLTELYYQPNSGSFVPMPVIPESTSEERPSFLRTMYQRYDQQDLNIILQL